MEAFLTNKASTQRTMTPPESVDQHPSHLLAHEPLSQVSDSVRQIETSYSGSTQTEFVGEGQSILETNEEVGVDAMYFTPTLQESTGYAQFQAPEYHTSVSPSETINKHTDNASMVGGPVRKFSESKESINSPQNVRAPPVDASHCSLLK